MSCGHRSSFQRASQVRNVSGLLSNGTTNPMSKAWAFQPCPTDSSSLLKSSLQRHRPSCRDAIRAGALLGCVPGGAGLRAPRTSPCSPSRPRAGQPGATTSLFPTSWGPGAWCGAASPQPRPSVLRIYRPPQEVNLPHGQTGRSWEPFFSPAELQPEPRSGGKNLSSAPGTALSSSQTQEATC